MIVAREPEQSDYELRRREQLLSKFRAPEGVRIYDLAGQKSVRSGYRHQMRGLRVFFDYRQEVLCLRPAL